MLRRSLARQPLTSQLRVASIWERLLVPEIFLKSMLAKNLKNGLHKLPDFFFCLLQSKPRVLGLTCPCNGLTDYVLHF